MAGALIQWPSNEEVQQGYACSPHFSQRFYELRTALLAFMKNEIYPNEPVIIKQHSELSSRWEVPPLLEQLKEKAKAAGLWNLFLPQDSSSEGGGLTNLEYAPLCEIMGSSFFAPEVFNCSAPDTGNMEILARFATPEVKAKYLKPLLNGEIRSCFGMTEPAVASSDATNIESAITKDGDYYVINGTKWWTSGAMDPRCKVCIFMGKTDPKAAIHAQQTMVVVPMDAPGVKVVRHLNVYGFDDAPHGHAEVTFTNVRVPKSYLLAKEGAGFALAQSRLGPGRIHHCMRAIGMAEAALALMLQRVNKRKAFGRELFAQGTIREDIATSRIEIEQARLLTLQAAYYIDSVSIKHDLTRQYVAMIKVAAPTMLTNICDRAIQAHGGMGVCQDTPLAQMWAAARTLHLADGPDQVHRVTIARLENRKAKL